ncbi:MAG: YmfQ family protein [Oscillospiraceae bacterium]|jgi:hypothetical protein|nr:YmfQ family protein [Oscillospiraceae bacterium]
MAYFEYLKELLAPTGLYELELGVGAAELMALGQQLDLIFESLEEFNLEKLPTTAQGYGLASIEQLLPSVPLYDTPEDRRRALAAMLRIRGGYFSLQALRDTLIGCGVDTIVNESETPMSVEVSFPGTRGVPDEIEGLRQKVEQILPCHLAVIYAFAYLLWARLHEVFGSWVQLESSCANWKELEAYE